MAAHMVQEEIFIVSKITKLMKEFPGTRVLNSQHSIRNACSDKINQRVPESYLLILIVYLILQLHEHLLILVLHVQLLERKLRTRLLLN